MKSLSIFPIIALLSCSAPIPYAPRPLYICEVESDRSNLASLTAVASPKITIEQKVLELFFPSNSYTLTAEDEAKIKEYIQSLPSGTDITIEGYADYRGDFMYNKELSLQRVESIDNLIQQERPELETYKAVYGESKAVQGTVNEIKLQQDRKVCLTAPASVIKQGLDNAVSIFYLIDQSKSMGEKISPRKTKWSEIQNYTFPPDSYLYTFSTERRACYNHLANEKPLGRTPLFLSMYNLLDFMEPNQSMTVLTDGDDTEGGKNPKEIIAAAQKKNIDISIIGLGLYDNQSQLEQIALSTGGSIYLSK